MQPGESLSGWRKEIAEVKRATDLWQWIDTEDNEAIRQRVRWASKDCIEVPLGKEGGRLLHRER